jgi:hypothetical protein
MLENISGKGHKRNIKIEEELSNEVVTDDR